MRETFPSSSFFLAASVRRINNKTAIMKTTASFRRWGNLLFFFFASPSLSFREIKIKLWYQKKGIVMRADILKKHKSHLSCHNSYLLSFFRPSFWLLHSQHCSKACTKHKASFFCRRCHPPHRSALSIREKRIYYFSCFTSVDKMTMEKCLRGKQPH
jgi:hypothetical protein